MSYRVGTGSDIHKLTIGKKMFLGGVEILHKKGFEGHSDADILLHSICDALLGASSLGDIGKHFPNTDKKYKDISSLVLLSEVNKKILKKKYKIINIDSTILLEKPKIQNYIPQMQKNISSVLNILIEQISIKATTTEQLGFVGKEEGAIATSVVLLKKIK